MTIKLLQTQVHDLERQVRRLQCFLDGYKTGMLDFDELDEVTQVALGRIRELVQSEETERSVPFERPARQAA